jgi:Flp pilus assembly pilin Flp
MAEDTRRFQAKLEGSAALRYALAPAFIAIALMLHIVVIGRVPAWSQAAP